MLYDKILTTNTASSNMIPINKPWMGEEEKHEVISVLEENALTTAARDGGKRVRDFESQMKSYLKIQHVVSVNSGTAALYAALLAAGIKQDDEVLIPSFTFVATANAVVAAGGRPIFVDVKKDDYTMDVSDLKAKITKKSRVVIPVHLYGHPSDIDEIGELAEKHSLDVIEDACQSLGSSYKNKQTGTFGTLGCFSMYASKVLTAGEGGAVATDSDELADKLKMIRNHGMVEGYDTRILGLNLRLPELSAAVAKVQMKKLDKMLEIRRRNAELLSKLLFASSEKYKVKIPEETADKKFNWYLYTVAFQDDRDRIKNKLVQNNVGATVYYSPPVHKMPFYAHIASEAKLPATEWCADHVLSLPVHPYVTDMDVDRMVNSLKSIIENHNIS
jgi:perosamine synthetase